MRNLTRAPMLGLAFSAFAAVCATYLSGLSFPEQNNIWTVPVVLDFAGSAEGPHDPYHASFARFVSLFWLALRPLATEATLEPIYATLQIAGNSLVAATLFWLVRRAAGSTVQSALTIDFLCFCYGLWGATRLGYSEVFSSYATHTQYSVVLCLIGLGLVASGRGAWAGAAIGVAAWANLFIGVWGAMAAGLALVADDRRLAGPSQLRFSAMFLLLALPVVWWALASGGEGAPPLTFFRTLAVGHIYAGPYPQATVQTFALGIVAMVALCCAPEPKLRRLGLVTGASFAVLGVGAAMPYVAEFPVLLLLHPLRFVSVTTLLVTAGAGALLVSSTRGGAGATLPPFIAVAGFMLKLPVVSLLGFALAVPALYPRLRLGAAVVAMIGVVATLLPTPLDDVPIKAALCFLIMAVVLATAAWRRPDGADAAPLLSAGALGAAASTVPLVAADAAMLIGAVAATACFAGERARRIAIGAAAASASVSLFAASAEPARFAAVALGVALLVSAPFAPGPERRRAVGNAALAGVVALFMVAGLARGALAGFAPSPDAAQRDWLAAQRWARAHTAPGAVFLPIDVDQGFALFARRPIWWEQSQVAAVFWAPSLLPGWLCRRDALAAAAVPAERVALARRAGVDYLLLPADMAASYPGEGLRPVFRNGHYTIAELIGRRDRSRICSIGSAI